MNSLTTHPKRWSTGAVALVSLLSIAVGFALGKRRVSHAPESAAEASVEAPRARSSGLTPRLDASARDQRDETRSELADTRPPSGLTSKQQRARQLTELAQRDPRGALSLALAEANWVWRADFRDAVLRVWAEQAPDAAVGWAMTLREADRARAVTAALSGAAKNPERAAALAARIADADPERAADYGSALISALTEAGAFETTARFVASRPASPLRLEQAANAFTSWAENHPQDALSAALALNDEDLKKASLHGAAVGWAQADPVAAANYAAKLPAGEARAEMLANAVPRWVEHDPVAAAQWLADREAHPDFDMGVVAVATLPAMVKDRPELALSLAQSIADAPLRTNTLRNLALQWAQTDAAAAGRYVEASPLFTPEERQSITAEIRERSGG